MEPGFQGLSFPAVFLLLPAPMSLTLFSVFNPGNAPGEPVTPYWILDGGHRLKVTLEELVSTHYPVLIRGPFVLSTNAVTVFLGFSEPSHCTLKPLPVRVGGPGRQLDGMSLHTWKSFWAPPPSFYSWPYPLLHWGTPRLSPLS